jgi:hypothetical protein
MAILFALIIMRLLKIYRNGILFTRDLILSGTREPQQFHDGFKGPKTEALRRWQTVVLVKGFGPQQCM